jgi:hypothetical protein
MVAEIVISANFSDASSRILAGTSEDTLEETSLFVSDVRNQPINAVKALAAKCKTALVLSRVHDNRKGWTCSRKLFRRIPPAS